MADRFIPGIYRFRAQTGDMIHTFEIYRIYKHIETGERRALAKLDTGKEKKYPILVDSCGHEYIEIPRWKTNITVGDLSEENKD